MWTNSILPKLDDSLAQWFEKAGRGSVEQLCIILCCNYGWLHAVRKDLRWRVVGRWLIVLIITHGCSAIIFIAVVVISKNTLKRGRVLSLTSCILTCVFVTSEARVLQTSARLSSRSRNRASQGKFSSHSRSQLSILLRELSFSTLIFQLSKICAILIDLVDFSGKVTNIS